MPQLESNLTNDINRSKFFKSILQNCKSWLSLIQNHPIANDLKYTDHKAVVKKVDEDYRTVSRHITNLEQGDIAEPVAKKSRLYKIQKKIIMIQSRIWTYAQIQACNL